MKNRFWLILFLMLGAGLPLWAVSTWFSSVPSSVNSGASYMVQATTSMPGGSGSIQLNKNSSGVAGSGGSSYFSVSYTTSDTGPQTVEYHAIAIDYAHGGISADAWAYVTVNAPPNTAPAGACDYTSPSLPVNGTLSGNGWAVDNEQGAPISRVDILIDGNDVGDAALGDSRPDVASAYGRSDFTYCGWHCSINIGALSVGTHTVSFRAVDNQGASTDFGSRSLTVTSNAPTINLLAPSAQTINLNTALTITSNAADADGDITTHNLDIQRPDGTWNWQGGFAAGEPYQGGPVGSGSNSTRSASFTFNQVGTWYVRSWVSDSAGNSLHSATVAITVINPNQAPQVSFTTQPPAFPNTGVNFTARATGTDADGNLSNVQVDVSINGGAWSAFAYNAGGNGSTNTSDSNVITAGAEGTTYKFRARAFDSGGLISNSGGYLESNLATVNRTPTATLQILDSGKNPLPIAGNGRAQAFINSAYYIRVSAADPDGRLAILYERHVPVGGTELDTQANVSGASASYDFGPYNVGATPGFIDTWGHASDLDASGNASASSGNGWVYVAGPDIDAIKLNQAALTISSATTSVYGNAYTATATGGNGTGALEWRLGTAAPTAPGAAVNATTGAVTANGTGSVSIQVRRLGDATYSDSAWSADFPISITARPITVTLAGSKTYTGTNASTGATASITTGSLAPGDTIAYAYTTAASANAGSYSGLVTATISNATTPTTRTSSYAITYAGSYAINKATLTVTANSASRTYGAANPAFTPSYSGFVNSETTAVLTGAPALATAATATSAVGTYPITAAVGTLAATNYQFAFVNGTLTVTKATLTVTANNASRTYGAANPAFTPSYSGFMNSETSAVLTGAPSLTTAATATSTVGTYAITAAAGTLAATNYQFTFVNGTLTINKATLTVTANNASRTYGAANPAFTPSYSGFMNSETSAVLTGAPSLTTAATVTSTVGAYPITAAVGTLAATNYQFTFVNGTLTVTKATLTVTANNASRTYGAADPAFTPSYSGFVNSETSAVLTGAPSLTTAATATSTVGSYAITAAAGTLAATNYQFTFVNGTLTVTKATLTVTANNASKVYSAANPAFTYAVTGFVNSETASVLTGSPALSTTANAASPVGTYTITAAIGTLAATNYQFTFVDGTLTVSKAVLTVTADNLARTYGVANPTFTFQVTGFVNGDTNAVLTGAPSLTTAATVTSTVGTYAITAAAGTLVATNYSFAFVNGTLTVNKATLTVTANNASRTYGAANPGFGYVMTGYMNGETSSVVTGAPSLTTAATATSTVGTYPITAAVGTLAATNYQFTFVNGTLTVNKATLTVTANNASRTYGAANPAFSYVITGFVNSETASVLTGAPSLGTTATTASSVGTYPITPAIDTLAAANYQFTFVNGTLTVSKAVLTITADSTAKTYGAANPAFTYQPTGFVNGDTSAVLGGAPALTTTATTASVPGTYTITAATGTLTATNYSFTFVNGTLTVNKAMLTVTADNMSRLYGAANPTFTVTLTGFVNGDTVGTATTGATTKSTTAVGSSPVGAYPITLAIGTLASAKYNFTLVAGTLTVTQKTLTLTPDPKSKVYGAAMPTLTYVSAGLVNGDTLTVLSVTPALGTTTTVSSAVGAYPITFTNTPTATNYSVVLNSNTLTVTKATIRVRAQDTLASYNTALPAFVIRYIGLTNGDTAATAVTGTPVASTTATVGSPVGLYTITTDITGVSTTANYDLASDPGLLSIQPRAGTTVSVAAPALTYSNSAQAFTATATVTNSGGGTINEGSVEFTLKYGATTIGSPVTATVSGGTATASLPVPAYSSAGSYTVSAVYQKNMIVLEGRGTGNNIVSSRYLKYNSTTNTTAVRGLMLIILNSAGVQQSAVNYDVYGVDQARLDMAAVLNALNPGDIFLMASHDAIGNNATLDTAMTSLGLTSIGAFGSTGRYPYVGLGVKGGAVVSTKRSLDANDSPALASLTLNGGNYASATGSATATLNKVALVVSAAPATRVYGVANPAFTPTYTGFVNGDTAASLSGSPSLTTSATLTSAVGSYPITVAAGTLTSTNYQLSYTNNTLTVNKATPAATFADRTRVPTGSTYTVLAGDLDAAFAHAVNPGSVTAPSGAATYTLVGPGTPVVAGTVLPGGAPVTIRASYPGDVRYNAVTVDSIWQLAFVDADADGLPDYWEQQYLGTLAYTGSQDPFNAGRTLAASYAGGLSPLPAAVVGTGLQAWYRADLGVTVTGGGVSQWLDASGHGVHLQQSTVAQQPAVATDATSGFTTIDFAAGERLKSAAVNLQGTSNDLTIIVVLKPAATQLANASLVDFDSDALQGFGLRQNGTVNDQFKLRWRNSAQTAWEGETSPLATTTSGLPQVMTLVKNGTTQTAFVSGSQQSSATVGSAMFRPVAALAVGGAVTSATDYFTGQVAEVLVYNRALTTLERQQVENDLGYKYSLTGFNNQFDSDGNGLPDWWERKYFNQIGVSPTADPDADGVNNLAEYQLGRNPLKPALTDTTGAVNLRVYAPRN